jgi:hypothetical protein
MAAVFQVRLIAIDRRQALDRCLLICEEFMARKTTDAGERISVLAEELRKHSDRAAGLLAAAVLENALAATIQERLLELSGHSRERLFGRTAPFSSFTAKIELGFCLGLYGCEGRRAIEMIRDIRDVFVEEMTIQSFDDSVITGLIKMATSLHLPKPLSARQLFTILFVEATYLLYVEQAADIKLSSLCATHPRLFAQANSAAIRYVNRVVDPIGRSALEVAASQPL